MSPSPRARLTGIATAAAIVALMSGCAADNGETDATATGDPTARPQTPPDSRAMTLMLNWTPNAHHVGIYAAQANGWYADAGIDLTVIEPAETGVEQAVASGAALVGMAQAESLLPARAAGAPVISIAAPLPVNDSSLFSLAEVGITEPQDMEGTTYGGFGGALETEIISELMLCDGADPRRVEFVNLGNVDYLAGMTADQFDTAWVFSGWDALRAEVVEEVEVEEIRFADWLDCIPNWYTPLFLANEEALAEDSSLVEDFLEVTARGYRLAADDPATAAELLVAEVPELDPALVEPAVAYYAPLFIGESGVWGEQDEQTWVDFADFLNDSGVATKPVDGATAFSNDYLPGA